MAVYRNDAKGARTINLIGGGHVLVEAGATIDIDPATVRRLGPDIVKAENPLPPVPKDLSDKFDHDGDGKPGGSKKPAPADDLKALRAEYKAKLGKAPFNGWDAATLREKIAAA